VRCAAGPRTITAQVGVPGLIATTLDGYVDQRAGGELQRSSTGEGDEGVALDPPVGGLQGTRACPNTDTPHDRRRQQNGEAMNERDAERLELLDRIADRVPELDLARQLVEWTTLPERTCTRSGCWTRSSPATSAASGSSRTAAATSLARCPTRWRNSIGDGRPVLLGRASVRVLHQLLHV
jgi:hypothetical protein